MLQELHKRIEEVLTDDLQYYMDSHNDPDFEENEFMYDDFEEIMEEVNGAPRHLCCTIFSTNR